ncbi:ribose-phosphate diphosphokinase [Candidatus Dojkabacteria bacterium]|nr:ribose-phosphate diphosphokinase [Candidatus Dojkabacteria bacterium]
MICMRRSRNVQNRIIASWGDSLEYAEVVSQKLGVNLITPVFRKFPNGETGVWIDSEEMDGEEVIIIKSLVKPVNDSLVEFLLVLDAIKRLRASKIRAVTPWLCYMPQDKTFRKGEALSSSIVANMINNSGLNELIVLDIHNAKTLELFEIPTNNIIPMDYFGRNLEKENLFDNAVVVAIDKGNISRANQFARRLGLKMYKMEKQRDLINGKVKYKDFVKDLSEKTIIIIDDYIGGGSTVLQSAKLLKYLGAKECIYCISHIFDNGSIRKIARSKDVDLLITTNASVVKELLQNGKVRVIDTADIIYDIFKNE